MSQLSIHLTEPHVAGYEGEIVIGIDFRGFFRCFGAGAGGAPPMPRRIEAPAAADARGACGWGVLEASPSGNEGYP